MISFIRFWAWVFFGGYAFLALFLLWGWQKTRANALENIKGLEGYMLGQYLTQMNASLDIMAGGIAKCSAIAAVAGSVLYFVH